MNESVSDVRIGFLYVLEPGLPFGYKKKEWKNRDKGFVIRTARANQEKERERERKTHTSSPRQMY